MASILRGALQRARGTGRRLFHRFGIHCATHQIRVLLICGLVITALSYPALAIYASAQPRFLADFSSQILGPYAHAPRDLVDLWDNLYTRDDAFVRAQCAAARALRVERVLVHSQTSPAQALDSRTLQYALDLEAKIGAALEEQQLPCLTHAGACLHLSPLAFFAHSPAALASDPHPERTLSGARNVSLAGVPLAPRMVTAGRADGRSAAQFLVLTYFFHDEDCLGGAGHRAWGALLAGVGGGAPLVADTSEARIMELTYEKPAERAGSLGRLLSPAYVLLALKTFKDMRRLPPTHNPAGLLLTGVVEVVVSTITSLSVCALAGFRITTLPWTLFPLVIAFIGAETMLNLVNAVVKTSIALPVKERVGEGLSKAGTSNSLRVLAYNIILGALAFVSRGAIRHFCAFAVVVLIAHWFLVHTFFLTVLSIDLQRLELEELLQQDASKAIAAPAPLAAAPAPKRKRTLASVVRSMLRVRASTNVSLLLLLAIAAALYFGTRPAGSAANWTFDTPLARARPPSEMASPAYATWRLLNPSDARSVYLRVQSPTILIFAPDEAGAPTGGPPGGFARTRSVPRTAAWLLRIVVLPMGATLGLLYALLLYLLKDADRLESQRSGSGRGGAEPDKPRTQKEPPLAERVRFDTLPRALQGDAELLASSADGAVVLLVDAGGEALLWLGGKQTHFALVTAALGGSPVTAVAVAPAGTAFALGTASGAVALWTIADGAPRAAPVMAAPAAQSAVAQLCFADPPAHSLPAPPGSRPPSPTPSLILAAAYENGDVATWDARAPGAPPHVLRAPDARWATLVPLSSPARLLALIGRADGALEAHDLLPAPLPDGLLAPCTRLPAGSSADPPARAHAAYADAGGARTLVLAAATDAGVVSVWDGGTGECVGALDAPLGPVRALRIAGARPGAGKAGASACARCGLPAPDGFLLAAGVGGTVLAFRARACAGAGASGCMCDEPAVWARRTRTASTASAGVGSGGTHSRHPSFGDALRPEPFPVSSHGTLSRRNSQLDLRGGAPAPGAPALLPVTPDVEELAFAPAHSREGSAALRSRWRELTLARCAEAACERGAWDVVGGRVVGVRRRPRTAPTTGDGAVRALGGAAPGDARGLSAAARERWELWTLDAGADAVPLAALAGEAGEGAREPPRLPFTRAAPLVPGAGGAVAHALAGFGNTVGVFFF